MIVSIDSVRPTVATESAPRPETKKKTTTPKTHWTSRLEHQFEHHRYREQEDRSADRALGVLAVMRSGDRLPDRGPQARLCGERLGVNHRYICTWTSWTQRNVS